MEELALNLLENSLAGFEPTVSRFESQSAPHFKRIMSDITLLRIQGQQIDSSQFTPANSDAEKQSLKA